jgi:hypothetical protein
MRGIAALVLCALLTAGGAQAAECSLKEFSSLDIAGAPDRVLVPVSFGDAHKQFALELTASLNYISEATVTEFDFKTRNVDSRFPTVSLSRKGQPITKIAYAPKFQISAIKDEYVEFLVMPQSVTETGTAGTIGTTMFGKFDFELDTAHAKMNLFLPDHCPGKVVYWTNTGFARLPFERDLADHITTDMLLDGLPARVSIQTSGGSEIGMNAMRRLFKLDETAPGMTLVETRPDGQKFYRYPFKTLTADGLTVSNPDILVRGEPLQAECNGRTHLQDVTTQGHITSTATLLVNCYGDSDLRLGLSVLNKLRVYFLPRKN